MKRLSDFFNESYRDTHTGQPITMQDIRLMAGEGKLTQKTIKQAIDVISKQRAEQAAKIKKYQEKTDAS